MIKLMHESYGSYWVFFDTATTESNRPLLAVKYLNHKLLYYYLSIKSIVLCRIDMIDTTL